MIMLLVPGVGVVLQHRLLLIFTQLDDISMPLHGVFFVHFLLNKPLVGPQCQFSRNSTDVENKLKLDLKNHCPTFYVVYSRRKCYLKFIGTTRTHPIDSPITCGKDSYAIDMQQTLVWLGNFRRPCLKTAASLLTNLFLLRSQSYSKIFIFYLEHWNIPITI